MGYYQWLPQDEQTNIKSVDKLDYEQAFLYTWSFKHIHTPNNRELHIYIYLLNVFV